jgi:hypothetical protein
LYYFNTSNTRYAPKIYYYAAKIIILFYADKKNSVILTYCIEIIYKLLYSSVIERARVFLFRKGVAFRRFFYLMLYFAELRNYVKPAKSGRLATVSSPTPGQTHLLRMARIFIGCISNCRVPLISHRARSPSGDSSLNASTRKLPATIFFECFRTKAQRCASPRRFHTPPQRGNDFQGVSEKRQFGMLPLHL